MPDMGGCGLIGAVYRIWEIVPDIACCSRYSRLRCTYGHAGDVRAAGGAGGVRAVMLGVYVLLGVRVVEPGGVRMEVRVRTGV